MPVKVDIDRVIAGIFHAFLNLSALTSHLFGALHPQRRSPSFMTNVYASCICINNCREVKPILHSFHIDAWAVETNLRGLFTWAVRCEKSFYHSDFGYIVRRAAAWNGRFVLHGAQKPRASLQTVCTPLSRLWITTSVFHLFVLALREAVWNPRALSRLELCVTEEEMQTGYLRTCHGNGRDKKSDPVPVYLSP